MRKYYIFNICDITFPIAQGFSLIRNPPIILDLNSLSSGRNINGNNDITFILRIIHAPTRAIDSVAEIAARVFYVRDTGEHVVARSLRLACLIFHEITDGRK